MENNVGVGSSFIETYSGKFFEVLDPKEDQIEIYDIAHALSMLCRFSGHCQAFYSVAEHSVIVSMLVEREHALSALMHDSSEAYLTDIASPVKPFLENYKTLEDKIMQVLSKKYEFTYPLPEEVKLADKAQLKVEAKYLMSSGGKGWGTWLDGVQGRGKVPKCLQPIEAKQLFLTRFWELSDKPVSLTGVSPIWVPN